MTIIILIWILAFREYIRIIYMQSVLQLDILHDYIIVNYKGF